jgi:sulfide:quinone oxidoreductase
VYPAPRVFANPAVADLLERRFRECGIEWRVPFTTSGIDPAFRRIRSAEGGEEPFDLAVLVPPHAGQPFLRNSPLAGPDGWVRVDRATLRAAPGIYALGDAADLPVSKSGAAAHAQAKVVVRNVKDELRGREPSARYDGGAT